MRIPEQGEGKAEVLERLARLKELDGDWKNGRAMTNVFLATEEGRQVAEEAYTLFLWENALDPMRYPSLPQLEREVVAMCAAHLGGDETTVGSFTSGGTESVLLAVKAARDRALARDASIRPEILLPSTAHPCFHKACHYLGIQARVLEVDPITTRVSPEQVADGITDQTVLLVGSAVGYPTGTVDPIPELGRIALDRKIPLHVDACIGGFMLPFFRELGTDVTPFDFSVPGVTSISMDLHKYALCAKGASVVLYRDPELRRHQFFTYADWPGYVLVNSTVQSSKSGGALAAAWATLQHFGHEGYLEVARGLKRSTEQALEAVRGIDTLRVLGVPEMCLFAIASEGIDIFRLDAAMAKRGWHMYPQLSHQALPSSLHVTMLPWNGEHIASWAEDLATCVKELQRLQEEAQQSEGSLAERLADLDLESLGMAEIEGLLDTLGVTPGKLGDGDMADVNLLLDGLPSAVANRVLTVFLDLLTRPPSTS